MRRAGEISSIAIERAMKVTKPGMTEHQLFATVDYESRMLGAKILAYPPVVASGKNAKIIHYIDNNQVMKDGDLVLMDAGDIFFYLTNVEFSVTYNYCKCKRKQFI